MRRSARQPRRRSRVIWPVLLATALSAGCAEGAGAERDLPDTVRLTVLHTSDWHSRVLPYDMDVLATDRNLGLLQENEPFGGVARLATIMARERENAGRTLFLDSGDCFQGAPIFNEFLGEVEFRSMSALRPDGVVIGNHEFDNGVVNLVRQARRWANFPLLAANYRYRAPEREPRDPAEARLADIAEPFTIVEKDGLTVGIIGVANFSSLSSISFGDNSMGIQPIAINQVVQQYVDLLRPHVNLIVAVSHTGLEEDEEMIEQTVGLDAVFGGHLHVVLDPPRVIEDASGRPVVLAHSGAFLKFVGRMDLVLQRAAPESHDFEVVSHRYEAIPIDSTIPEDVQMNRLLEPYSMELARQIDLTKIIAYAPQRVRRFGTDGGDSPLGNMVADAMRFRRRVETDFAATNSLGIRADITQGPITIDLMFNVFPFPNSITTMTLSGNEVQEMFDFNASRSASRGCATQLQVSGVSFVMDCSEGISEARAAELAINGEPLQPNFFYTLATNDFMARGGSGFRVLRFNNTQQDTGLPLRDAVIEYVQQLPTCLERCLEAREDPATCSVLLSCRDDVSTYHGRFCEGLHRHAPQEECLDALAPRCLERSPLSDQEICAAAASDECGTFYFGEERAACRDEALAACADRDDVSPLERCARDEGAATCLDRDPISRHERCLRSAERLAEAQCLELPCLTYDSDGRIQRLLPTNDPTLGNAAAGTDRDDDETASDAAESMERRQSLTGEAACE